jgi:uncharacterized LabA/DUF88 family protein
VARSSSKKPAAPRGRSPKSGGRAKSRPARRQADAASTSTPEAAKGQQGERIGVLIDADNVSHQHLPTLRRFIGETPISAARAYGDFHGRLSGWRAAAQEWPELELVDQRSYTPGKNAADMRLTIDAVKLMAGANPPTTLIFVTNDSDFTPVVEDAKRLGVRIVVMGERTHKALRSTAHHYLNLSELRERMETEERAKSDPKAALALLAQPSAAERALLSAVAYQSNRAVLHTDTSVLPTRPLAWAAWNYERASDSHRESTQVCLHYLLNLLQPLRWPRL